VDIAALQNTMMTEGEILDEVAQAAGLRDAAAAERATRAVLTLLGERLAHAEADALAGELPARLADSLRDARYRGELDLDELAFELARCERLPVGQALELVESVARVIADVVTGATLERVRRALPPSVAAIFVPPERVAEVDVARVAPRRDTLAEGRPSSRRPVSEAQPPGAHAESVARAENPHGDTKLSSARGLTQEREAETIAAGRPGSTRPLSDSHE
jgi:uncharacterized protein (DUF2267 family)